MKRHEKTWQEFLKKITLLGLPNTPAEVRFTIEPLAEALAMAAPQGPLGFPCQDGCCLPDQEILYSLTTALAEALNSSFKHTRDYSYADFVKDIYTAVQRDLHNEAAQKYVAQWPQNFVAQLAQWTVMVSPQATAVIQARTTFPAIWALIEDKIK